MGLYVERRRSRSGKTLQKPEPCRIHRQAMPETCPMQQNSKKKLSGLKIKRASHLHRCKQLTRTGRCNSPYRERHIYDDASLLFRDHRIIFNLPVGDLRDSESLTNQRDFAPFPGVQDLIDRLNGFWRKSDLCPHLFHLKYPIIYYVLYHI